MLFLKNININFYKHFLSLVIFITFFLSKTITWDLHYFYIYFKKTKFKSVDMIFSIKQ